MAGSLAVIFALCGLAAASSEAAARVVVVVQHRARGISLVADGRRQRTPVVACGYRVGLDDCLCPLVETTYLG